MNTCFQGAALYSKEEIVWALEGFSSQKEKGENFLAEKIKIAEDNYSPSWMRKFISGDSLRSRWDNMSSSNKWWYPYPRWLVIEGYVDLTEYEKDNLIELNVLFNPWGDRDEGIFCQLVNLKGTGKDCYLNPGQAAFILKYSKEKHNVD